MFSRLVKLFLSIAAATSIAVSAQADEIAMPKGEIILTVSGALDTTNMDDKLVFDADALAALGMVSVNTSSIWTEGVNQFEGVPLKTLVDVIGAEDGTLLASAINDYTVEIPVSDAVENGPIVAMLYNGEPMSVRDKGPLWIVYPYDDDADYRTEVIYSRSIWQLDRIEVVQ